MAKISSAFCDLPGMEAAREFQKRMEDIYNSPWMRQPEETEFIPQRLSKSIGALQFTPSPAFSGMSAIQSAVADLAYPSWRDSIGALDHSSMISSGWQGQEALLRSVPISELQSALSAHFSNWSAMADSAQCRSLALQKEYAVKHACALADSISSLVDKEDKTPENLPTELSDEDRQVIAKEMSSILTSEKNWEQRIMESVTRLKTTHPLLAAILDKIILGILIGIIANLIYAAIGQVRTPTKVYNKPQTTSQVVCHLEPLQEVKIIGEQPYYFQIEFTDNDTQETLVGFVSKRSIQQVDTQDETSALGVPD